MKRLALALTLAALAAPALAGAPVSLRDELYASGGRVTLGDLFDGAGAAAEVVVAPGPQPGMTLVLDAGRVQSAARSAGLDWANPRGFRRLLIKGDAGAPAAPTTRAVAVRPERGDKLVEILTYTRSLGAGEVVTAQDVVWTKMQAHLAPADSPSDAEAVIGLAARRPLREGAGVGLHDLASPTVIRKDQLVSVAYVDDGVNLVLQGKALSDASVGATFQVLNTQSKKTIEAVAAGPARAVAGPGAESLRARNFASLAR
jgi:flagella basal body P-ring formation protein FlgA